MKLTLTDDDGTVLDSVEFTVADWRKCETNQYAAASLLNELEAGPDFAKADPREVMSKLVAVRGTDGHNQFSAAATFLRKQIPGAVVLGVDIAPDQRATDGGLLYDVRYLEPSADEATS